MRYIILLLFLNVSAASSQGVWIQSGNLSQNNNDNVYSITADQNGNLYASSWAVGIFKSTDNGNNWTPSGLSGKRVSYITSAPNGEIYALSKTTDFSYIHRSTDGGAVWTDVDVRSFPLNYAGGGAMVFPSDGSIVAAYSVTVGPTIGNVAIFVIKSTDGGNNWFQTRRLDVGFVNGLVITGDNKILMGTSLAGIVYSTDNGNTFLSLNTFPQVFIAAIMTAPDNTLYISDAFGLFRSADNGNSFVSAGLKNSTAYLKEAGVNSNGSLVISMDDKKVYRSEDKGNNWTQINAGLPVNTALVSFTSLSGKFYAGSNNSGVFYFDQLTSVNSNTEKTIGYRLYQNFPNPFNPVTRIKYELSGKSEVNLKVFDMRGKEIAELVNSEQFAGSYTSVFDGTGLSSGIYFVRLKADNNYSTIKIILQK
ncbi:MAG: T9SS type A sorting domain-containing protein [Bacteroidetes bacterium]|nr:T9SS type A sorting domain-containing protein [Bacteroidota bacterium]